jgi:hypothetical protein
MSIIPTNHTQVCTGVLQKLSLLLTIARASITQTTVYIQALLLLFIVGYMGQGIQLTLVHSL